MDRRAIEGRNETETGAEPGQAEAARERLVALGEIAAEIAHELRNVLLVISSTAYLARQAPSASAPHIAKIERNARLAHSIVDDLMALARGDALHAEPIPLRDVVELSRVELGEADWEDAIPAGLAISVHPALFSRLLRALYENAIAVSAPRKVKLTTRAALERDTIVIEVADDGPGVPPEIAPRIFDALVTGRSSGTGLGLALAKRIAAAHGGAIALVPSAQGATFQVTLPSTP